MIPELIRDRIGKEIFEGVQNLPGVGVEQIMVRLYNDEDHEVYKGDPVDVLTVIQNMGVDPDYPHIHTATRVFVDDHRDEHDKAALVISQDSSDLPDLFLGPGDKLEVEHEGGLWKATVRRKGNVLHFVYGKTVTKAIVGSQLALEMQAAEYCRMVLTTMVRTGSPETRWSGLHQILPPYEWFANLYLQVSAKIERHSSRPRFLKSGLEWHLARITEYENDLQALTEKATTE